MKLSKNLLKTIAASVVIGGAVTSCVTEKVSITPETACEADCKIDHKHVEPQQGTDPHVDNCPACGMG